jgi:hypothetical protein
MDIYLISNSAKTPNSSEKLKFVEKFTLKEFKIIQEFFSEVNNDITFFEDFRLTDVEVHKLYSSLISSNLYRVSVNKISAIDKLHNVCAKAISGEFGIIGFCD